MTPEQLAQRFHEAYERLAPQFGYQTRPESAVPWEDVPEANRALMVAVATEVLASLSTEVSETPEENRRRAVAIYLSTAGYHQVEHSGGVIWEPDFTVKGGYLVDPFGEHDHGCPECAVLGYEVVEKLPVGSSLAGGDPHAEFRRRALGIQVSPEIVGQSHGADGSALAASVPEGGD